MKWKVMVSAPYMQPVIHRFQKIFDQNNIELIIPRINERLEEEELLALVKELDGVICGDDRFTERVLRSAPKLKVISKWGTGIDSIDLEACRKLGIVVRNTPDAFSEPVADSVIGYMLCFCRNLIWMDREMHESTWRKIPGRTLRECVLGVIGVGNVGKTVVRRAFYFGMRILGNDLLDMPVEFLNETGLEMTSKEDLFGQADFVSLNCDLNPTSFHLMNETTLAMMKTSAVLINTARGPIIDEPALIKALKNKQIAGAALDVFEVEPLPEGSPLLKMRNVLLSPHNANSSPEAWESVHESTIKNLMEELRKK